MTMDYKEQLRKQLGFIRTSSQLYDEGNKDEAVRIATALRVICHNTQNSTSLLKHLNAENINLRSTCEITPPDARFWCNLTVMEFAPAMQSVKYLPKLDSALTKRLIPFSRWWNEEIVYLITDKNIKVTRKDLILTATNKDGGAHVDSALEPSYEYIAQQGAGWSMTCYPDGGESVEVKFADGHCASLRQMGYEVLSSRYLLHLADFDAIKPLL